MENKRRVVVTGIGVITSNGEDKETFYENSIHGVSGIKECSIFDASKLRTPYVGEIEKEIPVLSKEPGGETRFEYIVNTAIEEMFADGGLNAEDIKKLGRKAYLSFATSLAMNDSIMGFTNDSKKNKFDPGWLTDSVDFLSLIKKKCGIKGGCYTTTSACAAGTTAAGVGFDLINQGKADVVVVGGADPLTEFSCVGFHSLKSLSKSICKPFDEERDGINIGEGGAFFLFETLENAEKRNAKIYGEILGYGINNDAYHITSPDPDGSGAWASMNMALSHSGIKREQVDYVNAHGTGTKLNDSMETGVLKRFFKDQEKRVIVSSNKSMIGHCLAAAGAIELAATLLCIDRNRNMPNINLDKKMELGSGQDYITFSEEKEINYALSNSFAFAGNTASILVGRYHK